MRKKKPPEHENLERWLVSYADFMTLLFAFFTTMYAISSVDAKKMGRLVLSMQAAFDPTGFSSSKSSKITFDTGSSGTSASNSAFSISVLARQANALLRGSKGPGKGTGGALTKIKEDISKLIMDDTLRDKVSIIIKRNGVIISLAEAGFFDSGRHDIRKESLPLLDKISRYLRGLPNLIRVTGHSDDRGIRTTRFPSNWDLSAARACYIVDYLIKQHEFDPRKLSAAGYAEYRPVASNDTAEGRARNRRVDLIIPAVSSTDSDPDAGE